MLPSNKSEYQVLRLVILIIMICTLRRTRQNDIEIIKTKISFSFWCVSFQFAVPNWRWASFFSSFSHSSDFWKRQHPIWKPFNFFWNASFCGASLIYQLGGQPVHLMSLGRSGKGKLLFEQHVLCSGNFRRCLLRVGKVFDPSTQEIQEARGLLYLWIKRSLKKVILVSKDACAVILCASLHPSEPIDPISDTKLRRNIFWDGKLYKPMPRTIEYL